MARFLFQNIFKRIEKYCNSRPSEPRAKEENRSGQTPVLKSLKKMIENAKGDKKETVKRRYFSGDKGHRGSFGYSKDEGFQSLAVAEVRWSKSISADEGARYATGLKYVMI